MTLPSPDSRSSSAFERLSLEAFEAASLEYDDMVDSAGALGTIERPEIDIACSSTDWVLPSFDVWTTEAEPWILRSSAGFVVLTKTVGSDGNTVLVPPESMWGFASPIISDRPEILIGNLGRELADDPSWDLVLLTGLAPDRQLETIIRRGLNEHFALYSGPEMTRCRVDIATFRKNELSKQRRERRRIANRCAEQGVELIDPLSSFNPEMSVEPIFERILRIEARSWKGREMSGIIEPTLQQFYRRMILRIPVSRLRLLFATLDGEDIGYILGHIRGSEYRGLQISYADSHRHLSIGSLLQSAEIDRAETTGIQSYDLGMDMDYKQRWATHTFTTRTTAIARDTTLLGAG